MGDSAAAVHLATLRSRSTSSASASRYVTVGLDTRTGSSTERNSGVFFVFF